MLAQSLGWQQAAAVAVAGAGSAAAVVQVGARVKAAGC
jgi:hypothetical protein